MTSARPTEQDVRALCLALPGVTERLSWDRPAWFARTLVARRWDDEVVTIKTDERDALAAADPTAYSWTPHHERSPSLVLVRLAQRTARRARPTPPAPAAPPSPARRPR